MPIQRDLPCVFGVRRAPSQGAASPWPVIWWLAAIRGSRTCSFNRHPCGTKPWRLQPYAGWPYFCPSSGCASWGVTPATGERVLGGRLPRHFGLASLAVPSRVAEAGLDSRPSPSMRWQGTCALHTTHDGWKDASFLLLGGVSLLIRGSCSCNLEMKTRLFLFSGR